MAQNAEGTTTTTGSLPASYIFN